jgi:hypothetical protein
MKYILLILLFIVTTKLAFAEVYKWVDDKGVVHFTDDIMQIPEKYQPLAEKMELPEGKIETKIEEDSISKKKQDIYKDRLGRGEEYWRGRAEEWRNKLKELQGRVESLRIKYNELTEKFNDSKSTAERAILRRERDQVKNEMDQYKIQIEEAKNILEKKLPEEAELYKAKPEWIKQ